MKILSIASLLAHVSVTFVSSNVNPFSSNSNVNPFLDPPASEVAVEKGPDPNDIADKPEDNADPNDKANAEAKGKPLNRRLLRWSPRCLSASSLQSSKAIDVDTVLNNFIKDDELVYCSSQDASITKKDIPPNCFNEMYRVELSAVIGVSHFFLIGTKAEDNNENENCPASIAMDQYNGGKKIAMIIEEDTKDLPKHRLGLASLGDILEAEEKVEAIPKEEYDYSYNNCAHYAQRIWQPLEFEETDNLATFLIENILATDSDYLVTMMGMGKKSGGLRALASFALGGKGAFKDYVEGVVYDQLEVVYL